MAGKNGTYLVFLKLRKIIISILSKQYVFFLHAQVVQDVESIYFMSIVVQPTGFSLQCRPRGRMPSICKQRKDKFWAKGSSRSMKRSTWLSLYILKRSWKAKPPLNTSEYIRSFRKQAGRIVWLVLFYIAVCLLCKLDCTIIYRKKTSIRMLHWSHIENT